MYTKIKEEIHDTDLYYYVVESYDDYAVRLSYGEQGQVSDSVQVLATDLVHLLPAIVRAALAQCDDAEDQQKILTGLRYALAFAEHAPHT